MVDRCSSNGRLFGCLSFIYECPLKKVCSPNRLHKSLTLVTSQARKSLHTKYPSPISSTQIPCILTTGWDESMMAVLDAAREGCASLTAARPTQAHGPPRSHSMPDRPLHNAYVMPNAECSIGQGILRKAVRLGWRSSLPTCMILDFGSRQLGAVVQIRSRSVTCERLVSIVSHDPGNITWTIGLFVKVLYLLNPMNMLNTECQNWALGAARSPNKKNTERQGHGKQAGHLALLEQGKGTDKSEEAFSFVKDNQALDRAARQF